MIRLALDTFELESLYQKICDKIKKELEIRNRVGELRPYLCSIHCEELEEKYNTFYNTRTAKILVFAGTEVKADTLKGIAKKNGINPNLLELHLDYEKNKHFDFSKLKNNPNYSDVIFGPIAHKCVGLDEHSSVIAMFEKSPEEYPKVIRACANETLKLTKNSFEKALKNTQRYLDRYSY